jgi:uncharacterized membrane protein
VGRGWPTTEWASAAAALAASYVAGFLLHRIGTNAVPSTTMNGRLPSDAILDETDAAPTLGPHKRTFSTAFLGDFNSLIQSDFALDITKEDQRGEIFYACRAALLANKRGQYCEQFQGLYAMSRGLLLAAGAAAPYYTGWFFSSFLYSADGRRIASCLALVLCFPIVLAVHPRTWWIKLTSVRLWLFFVPSAIVVSILGFSAAGTTIDAAHGRTLLACAVGSALSCFLFWEAYRAHTISFAKQVYSDFYVMKKSPSSALRARCGEVHRARKS